MPALPPPCRISETASSSLVHLFSPAWNEALRVCPYRRGPIRNCSPNARKFTTATKHPVRVESNTDRRAPPRIPLLPSEKIPPHVKDSPAYDRPTATDARSAIPEPSHAPVPRSPAQAVPLTLEQGLLHYPSQQNV